MNRKLTIIIRKENDENIKTMISEIKCSKLYANNELEIFVISEKNQYPEFNYIKISNSEAKDYNKAIKKSTGLYIQFVNGTSLVKGKDYDDAMKYIIKKDLKITCFSTVNFNNKNKKTRKTRVVLKEDLASKCNKSAYSYIFKNKDIFLKEEYCFDALNEFVVKKLNREENLTILKQILVYKDKEDEFYESKFYLDTADALIDNIKTANLSTFEEKMILYYLGIRFVANMNADNKGALNKEEAKQFFDRVKVILNKISDKNIFELKKQSNLEVLKQIFWKVKYDDIKLDMRELPVLVNNKNEIVDTIEEKGIDIVVMDYAFGKLNIDCEFTYKEFMQKGSKIMLCVDDQELDINENQVYSLTRILNMPMHNKYTFHVSIDGKLLKKHTKIYIKYIYKEYKKILPISFKKTSSKLSNNYMFSFYRIKNNRYLCYSKDAIKVKKNYYINTFFREILLYLNFIIKSKKKKYALESIAIRIIYWLSKPFFRKPIWLSYDKLYKAGDNGEYFYHYVKKQQDGIKKYYIINKDCPDYGRLKNENILVYKSLKNLIYSLNCSMMFSTHANPYLFSGFTAGIAEYFKDLITFKTACIQHGLSVNDVAKFQNRAYANTVIYYCASNFEIKNLSLPQYDYVGYDALKLTGLPRYDGLKNNDQKIILITPTWRHNSSSSAGKINEIRGYNEFFKKTTYFKVYNELVNDKRLINAIKNSEYRIVYLLHPAVSSQINDFTKNDYVQIIAATSDISYEKILTEASVMVTDFSGVQFDFAYMRKPLIYYQPSELPPHYEEQGLIYDKEGFGPICKTKDETVDQIIRLMKNKFKSDKKYIKRANNFFDFDDFNNCERMYEVGLEYQNKLLNDKE